MLFTSKMTRAASSEPPSLLRHLKWFRIIGSTPLEISNESLSNLSTFYVVQSTFTVLIVAISCVLWNYSQSQHKLSFDGLRRIIMVCAYVLSILLTVFNRFNYEKTIRKLMALQRVLKNSHYSMSTFLKIMLIFWALCLIFIVVYNVVLNDNTKNEDVLLFVANLLVHFDSLYYMSVCSHFLYLVNCIASCFSKLSETTFMENTDVKRFIRIYTHLDDVTGEVNRYFDFFVFYLIGTCLEELVFLTGLVYRGQEMGLAKTMVTASFELLMTLVAAASVIHTCQHISDQADRCNSVLLNHLINNPSTSNSHDLSSLTHLSMKNGLTLKLLKSIPINYSLGTSIITAYITYTIVLFQFYQSTSVDRSSLNNSIAEE